MCGAASLDHTLSSRVSTSPYDYSLHKQKRAASPRATSGWCAVVRGRWGRGKRRGRGRGEGEGVDHADDDVGAPGERDAVLSERRQAEQAGLLGERGVHAPAAVPQSLHPPDPKQHVFGGGGTQAQLLAAVPQAADGGLESLGLVREVGSALLRAVVCQDHGVLEHHHLGAHSLHARVATGRQRGLISDSSLVQLSGGLDMLADQAREHLQPGNSVPPATPLLILAHARPADCTHQRLLGVGAQVLVHVVQRQQAPVPAVRAHLHAGDELRLRGCQLLYVRRVGVALELHRTRNLSHRQPEHLHHVQLVQELGLGDGGYGEGVAAVPHRSQHRSELVLRLPQLPQAPLCVVPEVDEHGCLGQLHRIHLLPLRKVHARSGAGVGPVGCVEVVVYA
mmetsp:Transcript_15451/g.29739  ORF Transcript_15451/g.29739 Transcript_15451/m.29739 type:complete len:394 (-) Transcript_15451:2489-3670(-)